MNMLTGEGGKTRQLVQSCRRRKDGEETELPAHETSPGLPRFEAGALKWSCSRPNKRLSA